MNFLLGTTSIPILRGTLGTGPVLSGVVAGAPVLRGTLGNSITRDIVLDASGNASLYPGLDQRIDCALRTVLGEWWLDRGEGVPYFEELLKKNPDLSVVRQAFAAVILAVPGVQKILKLTTVFTASTRTFQVNFEVQGTDAVTASGTSEVTV